MKADDENHITNADRVAYLVAGYIRQTLTDEEHDELDQWITASDDNQRLFEELTDPVNIQKRLGQFDEVNEKAALKRITTRMKFDTQDAPKKKRIWMVYSIAASFVLLWALIIISDLVNKKGKQDKIIATNRIIQPGGNFATLQLDDGRTINLSQVKKGLINSTKGNEILKTADGQINYIGDGPAEGYHVLRTPVGGQYSVLLPDSTRVWLNSSSSLKYPMAFNKRERVVELTGEAYFEVKHLTPNPSLLGEVNGNRPFIVKVGNMSVEVLGTHFNVNAYEDEASVTATLLEGRIRVRGQQSGIGSQDLLPKEQARINKAGAIEVLKGVSTAEAVGWKDGVFVFKDEVIESVMRQIARWYNAEIVYEGKTDHQFNATIPRKEPIEKLLHVLEETNEVHFRIEGRRIVVL